MIKTTALALLAAGSLLSGTVAFAQDAATTTTTTSHTKKMAKPHKAKTVHAKVAKTKK
jgi:hypothetical protein